MPLPHRTVEQGEGASNLRVAPIEIVPQKTALELLRAVRASARRIERSGGDWREVIDHLRSNGQPVWNELSSTEQLRLLRHCGRLWEIHCHRAPEAVHREIGELIRDGFIEVAKGRVIDIAPEEGRFRVTIVSRQRVESLVVDAVVDCSGPGLFGGPADPLIASLLENGLARRSGNDLGVAVDGCGSVVPGVGHAGQSRVFALGWLRRAWEFECRAVPEIRRHAAQIAAAIARSIMEEDLHSAALR
jgi:uncharacterized NAD(P)/FAD-binding protein YdhS